MESIAIPYTGVQLLRISKGSAPFVIIPNMEPVFSGAGGEGGLATNSGDGGVFLGSDIEITSFHA